MAREVLRYGTARTEDFKKVESAPAAIFPLSAACRCASRPPSNPSELPSEPRTQSEMAGFSRILDFRISSRANNHVRSGVRRSACADRIWQTVTGQSAPKIVTLTVTFSVELPL